MGNALNLNDEMRNLAEDDSELVWALRFLGVSNCWDYGGRSLRSVDLVI